MLMEGVFSMSGWYSLVERMIFIWCRYFLMDSIVLINYRHLLVECMVFMSDRYLLVKSTVFICDRYLLVESMVFMSDRYLLPESRISISDRIKVMFKFLKINFNNLFQLKMVDMAHTVVWIFIFFVHFLIKSIYFGWVWMFSFIHRQGIRISNHNYYYCFFLSQVNTLFLKNVFYKPLHQFFMRLSVFISASHPQSCRGCTRCMAFQNRFSSTARQWDIGDRIARSQPQFESHSKHLSRSNKQLWRDFF